MSKTTKAQVKGIAKTGNAAIVAAPEQAVHVPTQKDIDTNCGVTREGVGPHGQRKEKALLDYTIQNVNFDTKVNFKLIHSKDKDMHYLSITFGQGLDNEIFVTSRKDGKGVCCMTDYARFMYAPKKKVEAARPVIEC